MIRAGDRFPAGPSTAEAVPTFDFETFSAAGYEWNPATSKWQSLPGCAVSKRGLDVVGVVNYVKHPTFAVLSLAYDLLDGKGLQHWVPQATTRVLTTTGFADMAVLGGDAHPWALLEYVASGQLLEAWNVGFEWWVWELHCVPTWGWPSLRAGQTRCAMAKARSHSLPGKLSETGRVLQLPHQKDPDGDRLLNKFSKPRNPTKHDLRWRVRPEEEPADATRLYSYNATDVVSEIEASIRTPDLSAYELEVWQADQRINRRGMQVNVTAVENCIAIVQQAEARYNAELRALTGGFVEAASEIEQLKRWLATRGCHMDSLKEESVDDMLARCEQPGAYVDPAAVRALRIRQMLGSASIKKLYAFRYQNHAGRLYDLYSYFASRTGRWTGNGPQPMNLPKGFFKTPAECAHALEVIAQRCLELVELEYPGRTALEVVAACLRGLICAAPGHDLICSDFSAIEGVVSAAITDTAWRMEVFRSHGKIYEASASKISGVPFDEFIRVKRETGSHHPLRNGLGKLAELSGGFGAWIGGWKRFGAEEHLGSDENIKAAILGWRDASPNFAETWGGQTRGRFSESREEPYGLEGAIIQAIRYPGQAFAYRAITYMVQGDVLYCRVPSGGLITYHRPRIEPHRRFDWSPPWEVQITYEGWNTNPQMGAVGWVTMDLYGGKAFENVVQKIARDFQAPAIVALERRGYPVVLHSHDEIAAEVRKGTGSVEEFEGIVNETCAQQAWARHNGEPWPVSMKGGWRGEFYGKFD